MPERVLHLEPLCRGMSVDMVGDDGPGCTRSTGGPRGARRAAWQHLDPPPQADAPRETVAFAWRAVDAFSEETERMLGHAAASDHGIEPAPVQDVVAHGPDRSLGVDEIGGPQLAEQAASAATRA